MFQMYDVVRLVKVLPLKDVLPGAIGTVLIIHEPKNGQYFYEVEFVDSQKNSLGVLTVSGDSLELYSSQT
jgi:hypothetical protein